MAFVLAEYPVKHPNYPNGDHYAVFDTEDKTVEYITIEEVQNYISQGITFYGNHPLAIKDTKEKSNIKTPIVRNFNNEMFLVYYVYSHFVVIEIKDTHNLSYATYSHFRKGLVRDCLKATTFGVGIIGSSSLTVTYPNIYSVWKSLIHRAYIHDEYRFKAYLTVTISDNWLFFPNFVNWYLTQENYTQDILDILELEGTRLDIDKDILIRGNKIYCDINCCLVPNKINEFMNYGGRSRSRVKEGIKYPCGVSNGGRNNNLHSSCDWLPNCTIKRTFDSINNLPNAQYYRDAVKEYKGINNIPEEQWAAVGYCFLWYKERKEAEIKRLAEYWYNYSYNGNIVHVITKECYDALINWTVDIND